jgi:DNA-binding PadR family transcriptional regulator
MVPDTRYAILGLLLREPSHGYELAIRFGELFGPGWEINKGQVYGMIQTLEQKGLVERIPGARKARNPQRYRATAQGQTEFEQWIRTSSRRVRPTRDTLYLKLALSGPQHAQHLLESIATQEQACVDRLRAYAESPRPITHAANELEALAREMIDEATSTQLHGELEWLAKMRSRVQRILDRQSPPDGSAHASGD